MSIPIDERVQDLISRLTLEEKATLLTARESPYNTIPRLGIPEYDWGSVCNHGVQSRCGSKCASAFPEPNALGATFNKSLIYNMSVAIGLEMRALWLEGEGEYHDSNLPHIGLDCWSPTINIGRDPRWGRMYEIASEDPYWSAIFATYFTFGLQNGSSDAKYYDSNYTLIVATVKHFDAYSLENYGSISRGNFDAIVSSFMFADTYWPAFKMAIEVGGAKGVMCSYNKVNGIPSCANDFLLNQTLRQKWGFQGFVTSDSGAIQNLYGSQHYVSSETEAVVDALEAGCDINSFLGTGTKSNMGNGDYGTGSRYQDTIPSAVNSGKLNISFVDKALFNTLRLRFQLGLFDTIDNYYKQQPYWNVDSSVINSKSHQELNIFAARSSMTLLQNENSILPFSALQANSTLAVIGPHFNASGDLVMVNAYTGQVCYDNTNDCIPALLPALKKYASNIVSAEGCDVSCTSTAKFESAVKIASDADYIILMMGNDLTIGREAHDRVNISLPGYQQLLAQEICALGKPTVLVLVSGGIISVDELKYECGAILVAWYPGFYGAQAIADTLFGANNPGGKLAVTMYWSNYTLESNYTDMDLTSGLGKTYKYWRGTPPLFPFAYGISYTQFTFELDDINCRAPVFCVWIENVGDQDGHETIFVFVDPPNNGSIPSTEPVSKMITHLIDFEKVFVKTGDKYVFEFVLDVENDLMLYDYNGNPYLFAGLYTLRFSNGVDQNLEVIVDVTQSMNISQENLKYRY